MSGEVSLREGKCYGGLEAAGSSKMGLKAEEEGDRIEGTDRKHEGKRREKNKRNSKQGRRKVRTAEGKGICVRHHFKEPAASNVWRRKSYPSFSVGVLC